MSKNSVATCNDCYFRHAGLCALPGDTPCPTFRAAVGGGLVPPRQARLVLQPLPQTAVPVAVGAVAHGLAAGR